MRVRGRFADLVAAPGETQKRRGDTAQRHHGHVAKMKKFPLSLPYKLHKVDKYPLLAALAKVTEVQSTKEELLAYHKKMFEIRRVEVACDAEYKARRIRGFCHLYDGQEAIAVGTEAALTREDDWITTYRCHGVAMVRGVPAVQVFAEQFGAALGCSRGKGGSMHLYNKVAHFYGGAAIVGAHVPVAAGLALYHNYVKPKDAAETANVSVVMYGDGAANQGQVWEAANMAMLWKLPVVFVIENNQYGMGTSIERSSALTEYYKQGGEIIPGVQLNGMDVLAVRDGMRAAKAHVRAGNGPCFVEAKTYRYHGHSMSDPGVTYRTRDEVDKTRAMRDPIEMTKQRLIDAGLATADELKEVERQTRQSVVDALAKAKESSMPPMEDLYKDVLASGKPGTVDSEGRVRMESELVGRVRMPDRMKSIQLS